MYVVEEWTQRGARDEKGARDISSITYLERLSEKKD